ncbi:hypothetical protein JHK87_024536 [Glycine soja]|nr:hypothetical protein JHK87_024536 [Glycine soja]
MEIYLMYLDQLGIASCYSTKVYCRQTLIGGNYGLLNTTTFAPNPDYYSVLKACSMKRDLNMGRKIHGMAVVIGFESDGFVVNILVVMYAKCCLLADSRRLFGGIVEQNVVSWNAMFSCYVQSESCGEAVGSFKEMVRSGIGPNEFSISIILNACARLQDGSLERTVRGLC